MNATGTIQYLEYDKIDQQAWDRCIDNADNGLVYGYAAYLNHMSDHWDALVLDDYQAIMPLPFRKKFGIYYLYQPFLTAQLGLFGNELSGELLKKFLESIPKKFKLWEFPLNHQNIFPFTGFSIYERKNFVLDLKPSFETINRSYRENARRNIKKALQYGCYTKKGIEVGEVIQLAIEQNSNSKGFEDFTKLYSHFFSLGQANCFGVFSNQHQLLASCAVLYTHKRVYYILVGNHPNGRTLGASHLLIDSLVREHAGKDLLLDFEGSDIRNLAFFYSSFGAIEEKYAAIQLNRLPWYIRLFKK